MVRISGSETSAFCIPHIQGGLSGRGLHFVDKELRVTF